ncbi:MAG: flagellar assembly protein FliH [Desulfitobacterium sp.]|nr:flagellar assembly protein FliH [Desulfitobacterium sp.]
MKLFTRSRIVKRESVEVTSPCLVECEFEEFRILSDHLTVVRDKEELTGQKDTFSQLEELEELEGARETYLSEAREEAKEILAEAEELRAQGELFLKEAQEEGEKLRQEILAEAHKEAEKLKEEISQKAYEEGYTLGQEEGYKAGWQKGEVESKELIAQGQKVLKLAQKAAYGEWNKVDETLLKLSLKVAERIVKAHIQIHPESLIERIRALSLLPEEREDWKLHVSSADYQWLSEKVGDELRIPLFEDQTLMEGDCFLECGEGIFDASLDILLERCEQLLREELRYGQLAESPSENR